MYPRCRNPKTLLYFRHDPGKPQRVLPWDEVRSRLRSLGIFFFVLYFYLALFCYYIIWIMLYSIMYCTGGDFVEICFIFWWNRFFFRSIYVKSYFVSFLMSDWIFSCIMWEQFHYHIDLIQYLEAPEKKSNSNIF